MSEVESFQDRAVRRLEAESGGPREEVSQELGGDTDQEIESEEVSADSALMEQDEVALDTDGDNAGDSNTLNPKALAERLGVDVEDIYAMEVPLGEEGESFSLGDLKDRWQDLAKINDTRTQVERETIDRTREIAGTVEEIENQSEIVRQQAHFYSNLANSALQQFEQVDWQALAAEPERYQQKRREFETALGTQRQMDAAAQQIEQQHQQMTETNKQRQAAVSKQVLKSIIPNWNNDTYLALREFAVEQLDYSPEEVDASVDWRFMRNLHKLHTQAQAPKSIQQVKRTTKPNVPGAKQAAQPNLRNAQGKFQSARQNAHDRPGDRNAFREMKQRQLEAERNRR